MSDHEKKIFSWSNFFCWTQNEYHVFTVQIYPFRFFLVVSRGVSTAEGWDREGGRDCISLLTILWV